MKRQKIAAALHLHLAHLRFSLAPNMDPFLPFNYVSFAHFKSIASVIDCIFCLVRYEKLGSGEIEQRLKVFDDRILDIVTIPKCNGLFLCYTSKEASICKHSHDTNNNGQLNILKRFFKVSAIKTILSHLTIQKVIIRPKLCGAASDATIFTVAVLLNDDSVYIYENARLDDAGHAYNAPGAGGNRVSFQLTKHIHPIEMRDLHGRELKNHRTNPNGECMPLWTATKNRPNFMKSICGKCRLIAWLIENTHFMMRPKFTNSTRKVRAKKTKHSHLSHLYMHIVSAVVSFLCTKKLA